MVSESEQMFDLTCEELHTKKGKNEMKLATNRYHVAIKGTKKIVNYYGYKTRKEAEEIAKKYTEATGIEHEVLDGKMKGEQK